MNKYNNQGYSMPGAMLAVTNILDGNPNFWDVNVAQEYHEEVTGVEEGAQTRACISTQHAYELPYT
jgi:hypothetical protein